VESDSSQYSAAAGAATLERDRRGGHPNGGFPEPPRGALVRVVTVEHHACEEETRVRLPAHLPAAAVRHVVCASCGEAIEAPNVREVDLVAPEPDAAWARPGSWLAPVAPEPAAAPPPPRLSLPRPTLPTLSLPSWRPSLPHWLHNPDSRTWRLASIPLAAAAVIGALLLIQGGSDESKTPFADAVQARPERAVEQGGGQANRPRGGASGEASFIRESSFSLALPAGWERTNPAGGATFAAASAEGDADATLWVERDPNLDFAAFEARSMDQLEALAGSARVVERVAAPTPEDTIVRLAADAPAGSPAYEVTLRASGPYLYYLATTVQPDADDAGVDGAKLIRGSFVPAGTKADDGGGG